MRLHACLLLVVLAGCSEPADVQPPRELVIAYDEIFEKAATSLEERYERDRPDIDVILVADADASDVAMLEGEADGAVALQRRIAVIVPADSSLRLIDLSRGSCDVIIGRAGTPLGALGRQTLAERGLDDEINPRLLESDENDLVDWTLQRQALGLTYAAQAAERADVRVVAQGAVEASSLMALSNEGRSFVDWLLTGPSNLAPLREHGFDLREPPLRAEPGSD